VPTGLSSRDLVRISLLAPSQAATLAAATLANHAGLPFDQALDRLTQAPSTLADAIDAKSADALVALLRAFGLNVRVDKTDAMLSRVDLSCHLPVWADIGRIAPAVAERLGRDVAATARALTGPGGLTLEGLCPDDARTMRRTLRRVKGVLVCLSNPETATYDIHLHGPFDADERSACHGRLRLLGLFPDPLTGAIASGVNRALRDHVLAHFPNAGIVAPDRAFQRFAIDLCGVRGWVTSDLADFLTSRTAFPRARFEVVTPAAPVRIEASLSYAAARQFRADYAAIGLDTRLQLIGTTA
jgi:hypothetical protein